MSWIFVFSTKVLDFFKYPIAAVACVIFLAAAPVVYAAALLKYLWEAIEETQDIPAEMRDKDRQ